VGRGEKGEKMGFFKSAMLRGHAAAISKNFGKLRSLYFDFIVREIKIKLGTDAAPDQMTLGGEADLALRAFQYWLYLPFSIAHPYVSEEHYREFSGHLLMELSGKSQKAVEAYFFDFEGQRNNYADLIAHVALPIARTITPLLEFEALAITGNILPFFAIESQIAIAEQFSDKETATQLESQKRIKYETWESGLTVTAPMFCFNCGCSFDPETRRCSLCGLLLTLVGPGCDTHLAPESGAVEARFERKKIEPTPAPAPRRIETASTDITAEMIEKGLYFRQNHFSSISNWEDRMFSEFGEKAVPLLGRIWNSTS